MPPTPGTEHQPTRELITGLGGEEREELAHLLGCPACRRFAEGELIFGHDSAVAWSQGEEQDEEETWDETFARQSAELPALFRLAYEDQRRAAGLLEELLQLAPLARRSAARWRKALRRAGLAELLLARAKAELPENPTGAAELAGLARAIAVRLPAGERLGRGPAAATLADCVLGEARRRLGQLRGAERVLERAALAVDVALDDGLRAYLCLCLGKLRWQQRRIDEAAALLGRAGRIYSVYQDASGEGACWALLGFLRLEAVEPERALGALRRAVRLLELETEPELFIRSALALAFCHAVEGRGSEAERVLAFAGQAREERSGVGRQLAQGPAAGSGEEVAAAWWEGRIAARLGNRQTGLSLLDIVRRRLLAEGSLAEAAFATLDLAVLMAAAKRKAGITLAGDLRRAFPQCPRRIGNEIEELERLGRDEVPEAADRLRRQLLGLQRVRADRPRLIRPVEDLVDPPVS
ncbi:MAG TPA: hypothetical protein VHR45_00020 [Thermoanaerobaculia bacterium]|nr:hypothetical protein [Thermoanaerobaculia bacterium]